MSPIKFKDLKWTIQSIDVLEQHFEIHTSKSGNHAYYEELFFNNYRDQASKGNRLFLRRLPTYVDTVDPLGNVVKKLKNLETELFLVRNCNFDQSLVFIPYFGFPSNGIFEGDIKRCNTAIQKLLVEIDRMFPLHIQSINGASIVIVMLESERLSDVYQRKIMELNQKLFGDHWDEYGSIKESLKKGFFVFGTL